MFALPIAEAAADNAPGVFHGPVAVDSSGAVRLSHRFIDPATLTAVLPPADTLTSDVYTLDPTRGLLQLTRPLPPADTSHSGAPGFNPGLSPPAEFPDTLIVAYRYLPVSPPDTVQRQQPLAMATVDSMLAGQRPAVLPARDPFALDGMGANLRRSGHITRGVQVGTGRDVSLESGLRLSLEGSLARDIRVKALLDDRNLPIQPEGTSRRLDEIDQVYVEIDAGRAEGRFGDYRLETSSGRFGELDRRLEGGRVSYDGPGFDATAAGAVTRAVFHSNRFSGVDGVQGPYRLTGRDGERDFLVIGGSETVWVDGVKRQRGAASDYTIDYNRGEITFTPYLPITSESRIEVDFEYSPEAFPRNLYAAETSWRSVGEGLELSAMITQEGDDPDRPLGFELTPTIRDQLAAAGDAGGRVLVPTAEEVEVGEADYVRRDTVWTDGESYSIYVFLEPDEDGDSRGNWRVPFSELGVGQGEYVREYDPLLGRYRFSWVGPGNGSWTARRSLPLPERRRHAALSLVAGRYSNTTLRADLGLSDVDDNVLSPVGDGDNTAMAAEIELTTAPLSWGVDGPPAESGNAPLLLTARYRGEPGDYRALGRNRDVEFERRWGLDSTSQRQDENEVELRVDARPLSELRVHTGGGWLQQGSAWEVLRSDAGAEWLSPRLDAALFGERIVDQPFRRMELVGPYDDITRARGHATTRVLGVLRPGVDGEWERRESTVPDESVPGQWSLGHQYQRLRYRVGVEGAGAHSGSVYLQQRQRDRQVGASEYDPLYDESGYGAQWTMREASWRSRLEFSHSGKQFAVSDSADVTTDLAALAAGYSPLAGALNADLNYQLSRTVTRPSALIAYTVPAGQGDYIRVDGEYVYDPEVGDIILRPEPTGEALPSSDLAAALNLDWSPHRLPGGAGRQDGFGWEDISLVTQLEALEITRWDNPAQVYLFDLSAFQTDSTVQGRLSLRQDVYFFRGGRSGDLRVRYLAEQRLSNLYLTGAERIGRDAWSALGRMPLGDQFDTEAEGRYERLVKDVSRRGGVDRYRLIRARDELGWRPNSTWRISLELGGLLDHDIHSGEDVLGVSLTPGLIYAVRGKGRISADFEALWVETQLPRVPFELADGRPKGRNGRGNLRAELQLGEHLTGRAVYTVRLDQGRDPIHVARMEVSAFF